MLSRENVNSCAPYYILDASQQERISDFNSVGRFNLIFESGDICMARNAMLRVAKPRVG